MPKNKKKDISSDSDSGPEDRNEPPPKKKSKEAAGNDSSKADGPNKWTLEKMRQVQINEFRGRKMVDIREFYEKNGEMLPGRKGISLSLSQWKRLMEIAPEVDKALND